MPVSKFGKPVRKSIHQLPPNLINRIAAGEVIERPASVVKELIENAIDAGATQIVVEIEDGGRELIRVTDDGNGIPAGELPLAFASHATSKIRSDDDLFRILTMGFRGEALASVGSVSHARLLSRSADDETAHELQNRGGEIGGVQAAAGNRGTTVEVRNLFFNVPARRKFLKGTGTEFGYVYEQVMKTALPHPHVAFKLTHGGKTSLELPAASEDERWLAAWPEEFRDACLPLKSRDAELRIRGIVGRPELARPTGKYQYVFLNGRPIRDKTVQHALRESYRGLTEPGRFPAAILLIDMPPGDVDVNVHPTKVEVRFRDSQRIHGLVLSEIRHTLLAHDLSPTAVPMRSDEPSSGSGQPVDERTQSLRASLAEFFKAPATIQNMLPTSPPSASVASIDEPRTLIEPSPTALPSIASLAASSPRVVADSPSFSAMQIHNSYLVAQSDEGLIIIDQHALHERVLFEELLARVTRGPLEAQHLLIPLTIEASSRQMAMAEQIQPLLAKLGIDISPFGPTTLAIQSFPSFLHRLDPAEFVRELLERGEQELLDLHEEELLHEILDMMSCKAAVKAGDTLSPPEIAALLARKDLVERSSNCPHGRPTTLKLTLRDLEKQFKRTGF